MLNMHYLQIFFVKYKVIFVLFEIVVSIATFSLRGASSPRGTFDTTHSAMDTSELPKISQNAPLQNLYGTKILKPFFYSLHDF